jgi:hypothetical protein
MMLQLAADWEFLAELADEEAALRRLRRAISPGATKATNSGISQKPPSAPMGRGKI